MKLINSITFLSFYFPEVHLFTHASSLYFRIQIDTIDWTFSTRRRWLLSLIHRSFIECTPLKPTERAVMKVNKSFSNWRIWNLLKQLFRIHTIISNEKTFLQDFLVILKQILKKRLLGATLHSLACWSLQRQHGVSLVVNELFLL